MSITDDPYTAILAKIWERLEGSAKFRELVKDANRIKINSDDEDPFKHITGDADGPQVQIILGGGGANIQQNSTSQTDFEVFEVQIATPEKRIQKAIGPVKWAVRRAMSTCRDNLGLGYVVGVNVTSSPVRIVPNVMGRGCDGWLAQVFVRVDFRFTTAELAPETDEP